MNPDGSDLRDLTPGEGVVESHVLDAAEQTVYFSWNHGDIDRNVLFQQTTDLAEKLRDKGVVVEVLALPDEVHGFLRYASWIRVLEAAQDFFDRRL